jgi:methionyl-tRNA formyltransferase
MRIVFMGTPAFAVPSLQRLLDDGHEIVGVFTQPDKPKGRGYKLAPSPVKELALAQGLAVYQPVKMRDGTVLSILRELAPELVVVVAYGRLLPKETARGTCPRLHQRARLAAAKIPRRGPDPVERH